MHVAVAGAGITGVATGLALVRDGHRVTLIDPRAPGDPGQASHGNAGILAAGAVVPNATPGLMARVPRMLLDPDGPLFLRWSYLPRLVPWLAGYVGNARPARVREISAALAPMVTDAVDQHRALARGTGAERHIGPGRYTYLYRDRAAAEADSLGRELRAEHGIGETPLDRAALLARDPEIGPDYGHGVEIAFTGHVTDPAAYVAGLFAAFREAGGEHRAAEVEDIRPAGEGVAVVAGGETLAFDRAVLAMGAWSGPLAERLGHRPRLESERGYHLMLWGASHKPHGPYMLADAKCAVSPMEGGLRLAGLVELGGLRAGPSAGPTRLQRKLVRRIYPRLRWESETVWMGHRPSTVDGLPFIGESTKAPGVYLAFGAQHLGLTMAPKTARLIADLMAGRRPNIDLAPYAPGRFDRG